MSYIPVTCTQCGGTVTRISVINPNLRCTSCNRVFELLEKSQ